MTDQYPLITDAELAAVEIRHDYMIVRDPGFNTRSNDRTRRQGWVSTARAAELARIAPDEYKFIRCTTPEPIRITVVEKMVSVVDRPLIVALIPPYAGRVRRYRAYLCADNIVSIEPA